MPKIDTDTEEGKAELQKLIDAETKGLKDKNSELLGKLKKTETDMKSIQEQIDEIKTAKEKAEEEAASKSGDVETIKRQLQEKHTRDLHGKDTTIEQLKKRLDVVLVENGLTEALTKANVAPQFLPAAKALIRQSAQTEVVDRDGNPVAMIDGKSITEYVSEWSQGDNGKHYVAAQLNHGGGTTPSGPGKAQSGQKRSEMSPVQKAAYIREHGQEVYNSLPA